MLKYMITILFLGLMRLMAKPLFEMTPPMYAGLMTQTILSQLPQKLTHENIEIIITHAHQDENKIYLQGITTQYKKIVDELKKYNTLPENLKKECKSFSQTSFVDQGVEYIVRIDAKNQKPLFLLYDKEACLPNFNPQKKIFIGGYNRFGFDMAGRHK